MTTRRRSRANVWVGVLLPGLLLLAAARPDVGRDLRPDASSPDLPAAALSASGSNAATSSGETEGSELRPVGALPRGARFARPPSLGCGVEHLDVPDRPLLARPAALARAPPAA